MPTVRSETRARRLRRLCPPYEVSSYGARVRRFAENSRPLENSNSVSRPASGGERSLIVRDLVAAAEGADVNLVILRSQSARQPEI